MISALLRSILVGSVVFLVMWFGLWRSAVWLLDLNGPGAEFWKLLSSLLATVGGITSGIVLFNEETP